MNAMQECVGRPRIAPANISELDVDGARAAALRFMPADWRYYRPGSAGPHQPRWVRATLGIVRTYVCLLALCLPPCAIAQRSATPPASAVADPGGVAPEWDVRARLVQLAKHTQALEPVLAQIRPDNWAKKGASPTYADQARSVRSLVLHVIASSRRLAEQPERLSPALETLFRIEALEQLSASLAEGILRYQDAGLASRFIELMASISGSRELLRQHTLDVASMREEEYEVLSAEAQRCRGNLLRGGATSTTQRRDRKATR